MIGRRGGSGAVSANQWGGGATANMESVALVAPVTALEFAGDVLLAGEHRDRLGLREVAGPAEADAVSHRHGPGGGGVPDQRRRDSGATERAA